MRLEYLYERRDAAHRQYFFFHLVAYHTKDQTPIEHIFPPRIIVKCRSNLLRDQLPHNTGFFVFARARTKLYQRAGYYTIPVDPLTKSIPEIEVQRIVSSPQRTAYPHAMSASVPNVSNSLLIQPIQIDDSGNVVFLFRPHTIDGLRAVLPARDNMLGTKRNFVMHLRDWFTLEPTGPDYKQVYQIVIDSGTVAVADSGDRLPISSVLCKDHGKIVIRNSYQAQVLSIGRDFFVSRMIPYRHVPEHVYFGRHARLMGHSPQECTGQCRVWQEPSRQGGIRSSWTVLITDNSGVTRTEPANQALVASFKRLQAVAALERNNCKAFLDSLPCRPPEVIDPENCTKIIRAISNALERCPFESALRIILLFKCVVPFLTTHTHQHTSFAAAVRTEILRIFDQYPDMGAYRFNFVGVETCEDLSHGGIHEQLWVTNQPTAFTEYAVGTWVSGGVYAADTLEHGDLFFVDNANQAIEWADYVDIGLGCAQFRHTYGAVIPMSYQSIMRKQLMDNGTVRCVSHTELGKERGVELRFLANRFTSHRFEKVIIDGGSEEWTPDQLRMVASMCDTIGVYGGEAIGAKTPTSTVRTVLKATE